MFKKLLFSLSILVTLILQGCVNLTKIAQKDSQQIVIHKKFENSQTELLTILPIDLQNLAKNKKEAKRGIITKIDIPSLQITMNIFPTKFYNFSQNKTNFADTKPLNNEERRQKFREKFQEMSDEEKNKFREEMLKESEPQNFNLTKETVFAIENTETQKWEIAEIENLPLHNNAIFWLDENKNIKLIICPFYEKYKDGRRQSSSSKKTN